MRESSINKTVTCLQKGGNVFMKRSKVIVAALLALMLQFGMVTGVGIQNHMTNAAAYELIPVGVGNQNSYRSSGGSSSRSGSSYSGSYRSGSSSDGESLAWLLLFMSTHPIGSGAVIVILILLALLWNKKKNGGNVGNMGNVGQMQPYQPKTPADLTPLEALDPEFSADQFISWAKEVFVTLNQAWTAKDWSKIRPFESDALFKEHSQLLEDYINGGKTNVLDRVAIKDAVITNYYEDSQNEYLEVTMLTNMIDYVVEDATGKVTAGDKTTLWDMEYTLKFMRSRGVKTAGNMEGLATVNCPNCGAPTEVTSQGQCEYCKSVITTGKYNWVLCSYTGRNL